MANETTTTTLTEVVNSEAIEVQIMDYAKDEIVIAPWARAASLIGKGSLVTAWPRWDKDAGSDITQGTAMANQTMDLSEVTTTAAGVGVLREILLTAQEATIAGIDLVQYAIEDGTYLCTEMLEDDLAATFSSATGATVGVSGQDFTLANFVEAIAKMRTAKARGQYVCVLDDQQGFDFQQSVATAGAAVLGGGNIDQSILNARNDGYMGSFMNVPIAVTNLTDTANGGADVVGCMFVNGNQGMGGNPKNAGLGWNYGRLPTVKSREEPSHPSLILSVSMVYGASMIYTALCVQLVTDA